MKLLQSKKLFLIGSFLLGVVSTYIAMDLFYSNNKLNTEQRDVSHRFIPQGVEASNFINDRFSQFDQFHEEMRRRMESNFDDSIFDSHFFGNNIFDKEFYSNNSSEQFQILEREDKDYKYIEILTDVIDKDSVDVNISDGVITVSGEVRRSDNTQDVNSRSMSSFLSRTSRSFSAPYGVREDDVKISTDDNKIILKFPKVFNRAI